MLEKVESIKKELESAVVNTAAELEEFRIKFISRKSVVNALIDDFKNVPNDQKKQFGQNLNQVKNLAQTKFEELIATLSSSNNETD